ncbi:MAG TPA: tetratricopeptide repeat protein, partial [Isosphaeraceae bacterium]|nr:tetratricopeptide repeat protein [Isosphaeraceae bacterium]
MVRHHPSVRPLWLLGILAGLMLGPGPRAVAQPADPAAIEEARELQAMRRFLALLERNPRRGTALDRVYGFHVERGSLDDLLKSYRDRLDKNPHDGTAWLILGLLEFQRGQDAAAVAALRHAEADRPADPLPPYYLGQALVLVGQPDQAADAFERALQRKPLRTDLLEIFQALGRVYQRTQKTDKALQVWQRLEALFPNDLRVQEQIAAALAEEDQPALALPRFETLAKRVADPFRQVQLAMQAAELKVRLGKSEEALRDFEAMLGKLRPESWLHREVRRKIEEVFLRNDDQAGLVTYYQRWTAKEPEDVEALVRLGRTLAAMGRVAEAQTWYEKAIQRAPGRRDLRLALIAQLAQDQKYAEAAAQYEALDKAEPNNPDTLRDWGALVLRDTSRPPAERKSAAAAIWRKLRAARPNDAVTTAQVADLLRQAELVDEALALYRQACAQAPNNPQYREYLGEYLHQLKRPAEAQAEWARIAEGPNRNARNLARLAEVLAGFGYLKEAIAPLKEAVDLEQEDFDLRLKLAELSHKLERYDDAAAQLLAASKLAEKAEEKSAVLEAQVKNDQAAGRLAHRIEAMRKALESGQGATAEAWGILARYLEADGKLPEAVRAADRAIQTDPRSVPAWTLAARVRESAGNLGDAADAMRRLAELDRKNRAEYLTGIAKLESRLGRIEAALKAGRDLLAAAPGNPEHYEFFAQLCFQLGRSDEGLDVLRRAARINANDPKITLTLAETLAGLYRTDEAIEMYWRAFDKAEDLDAKLGTVSRLTELYLQRNQFDRLLTRLQHQERDARPGAGEPQQRDVAICMAQAYAASGDLGSARAELERLLAANTRDTKLLQQLSKLSEEEGDLETAARYQKQLEDLAPSDEGAQRLAQLYARAGELEEAQAVWSKIAAGKSQAHRIFQALDNLLANHKYAAALETTEALVRKDPKDWEALYRQGVALASCDKPAEAEQRFRALLELTVADDEKSAVIKAMSRDPRLKAAGTPASSPSRNATIPLEDRLGAIFQVRMACKLDNREVYYAPGSRPSIWSPPDFGQARMAALGWLLSLAQKESPARANEFLTRVRQSAEQTPSDLRALWDWFYLCGLRQDNLGVLAAGRALSRAAPTDPLALWAYLYAIGGRSLGAGQRYYISQFRGPQKDTTPPLEKDELEHVLACYRSLRTRRPELAQAQILQNVSDELKRAKRVEDEERFYREAVAGSTQLAQIVGAFAMASQRGDVEGLIQLRDRYERLQPWRSSWSFSTGSFYFHGPGTAFSQGMGACAERKAYGDILRLLDFNLAAVRRRMERQTPGAARARRARTASSGRPTALPYTIWVGKTARNIQIAFPLPNEYLDDVAIQVLRTAYEIFKRDDLVSDLVAHLRRQAEAAQTPADAIYPRLALSDVLWWNDDKDEAIAEFTKVAEASRAESDLRLDLAELLEQQGQRADALALAESVQPQDNTTMKRREELALRLAVASGDLERARQAAERLFGLRLDTDTQVRLAGQMHQLGLHELAEAVLSRARRRAGNKATALVGMMLQYQRQGQLDVAVQVAMQILRSTTATRQTNPNVYYAEDPDASRTAAIGVLARSGRLPQLIDRANEQLKKTPNAIQIHQALADYYKAAGQRDRARAELDRMIALRPDDTNLRLQVAQQLVQEGQAAAAVDQYKVILEKDPALVSRRFFEVQRIFQQARKTDELMNLLETMDLRRLGNWSYVFNVISNLLQDDTLRNRAMNLVRKAWEAFPDDRSNLLRYLGRGDLWQMPEMYDYAVESLVPTKAAFAPAIQWNTLSQILSYSPDGRMNSVLSQLLDLAASQGRLDELAARVDAARGELPGWTAGAVVRALIDCRLGRYDRAQSLVRQLLDSSQDQGIPSNVLWVLGAELEGHAPTRDLAIAAYEATLKGDGDDPYSRLQFDYGPARRLVSLYAREDRREDARRVLVRFARTAEVSSNVIYPPGYIEQMKMQGLGSAAGQLLELGYA